MAGVAPLLEKLEPMAMMEEGGLQRASIAIKLLAHKSATDPSVGGGILEARGVRILLQEALGESSDPNPNPRPDQEALGES